MYLKWCWERGERENGRKRRRADEEVGIDEEGEGGRE